ncbi:VTT domain-containing protein [Undibacterium amnicola]|uniref:VTT domain-containing protein n=1 Tax=Undibacterium amnicola TaxID=1834038 RepID=A0ABR6XQJ3_9BURK|nr:VTT domain-containing protein [Undibacterium amnicola]MBC3831737.1 VTT domain-containing protein [Undibacterium amnicola]
MDFMQFLDMVLHVDKMGQLIEQYGTLIYVVLFAIIFCETAFVVFPFLPGDSLLFIAGTFCAAGAMDPWFLIAILLFASISGNSINYWIGSTIGHRVMAGNSRWIDKGALEKTHAFYEKHGGKTIVLARFTPIVRTFAPFVAGFSEMSHRNFQFYNVLGAILWIVSLILAGYYFGHIPLIKNNLSIIVMIGVGAAIVPIILGLAWKFGRKLFAKKTS